MTKTTTAAATTTRDKCTGRFADTRFDKPCTCGHTLGAHTADRAGRVQPCLADDCGCEVFTKTRTTGGAR